MLNTLRRIVQEVSLADDLDDVLTIIVNSVKKAITVDVCSIYLRSDDNADFVLMATNGLNPTSVGKVVVSPGKAVVGMVAERGDPVNLADASAHPRYKHYDSLDEEGFHGFSGVPIIHHKEVLGILVVQSKKKKAFSQDVVSFLITIASQVASSIIHAQAVNNLPAIRKDNRPMLGQPGSPGVAIGNAYLMATTQELKSIPERTAKDQKKEIKLFLSSLDKVKQEIKNISERIINENLPAEDIAIFDAYLLMLDSQSLKESTIAHIKNGHWAPGALRMTIEEHIKLFHEMDNPYLQERKKDINDLGQRILDQMLGNHLPKQKLKKNTILVGEDLSAMHLGDMGRSQIIGLVSVKGSRTSHIAILARAMGIPTVMGVKELPLRQLNECQIIVDGYSGKVFLTPPASIRKEYQSLAKQEAKLSDALAKLRDKQAITKDGVKITLYANTGLEADISPSKNSGAEGIGLYRTEFPFMISQGFPGEEEQTENYKNVLEAFSPQPVILRTLDIGGDKSLPYFPIEEENPFLGWRGIRITLDHPEIFIIQLRAMLLANTKANNLYVLFPMVSTLEEIDEARFILSKAYHELVDEGYDVCMPKVGVMIEVPSLVFQIKQIARMVDFISIGTNDLIQYLLAVDRNNAQVAELYESMHPGVIEALNKIISDAHGEDITVSVCGEMASDPLAAILLLGMGIDSLSCSVASLPRIKWVIRKFTKKEAEQILEHVLLYSRASQIKEYLIDRLEEKGLGGLVRAGN